MRVCFRSSVNPSQIPEYRRRHAAVWPEMLRELKAAGWNNYSLFLADDGLLVGYVECDDFDAARARMALTEVNARWQAEMATLFDDEEQAPDQGFLQLTEIFNLEDQLSAAKDAGDNHQPQKEQS
jgi:L-rhamnose mutarotase